MRLLYLLAIAAAAQLATGCAARWRDVTAIGDVGFMQKRGNGVATVELLPLDVGIAAYPGSPAAPEQIAMRFGADVRAALGVSLAGRGYRLVADASDALFAPDELAATAEAFVAYGRDQSTAGALLSPRLPARLGRGGADATLYVGGFGYAGEDGGASAGEVAKWVFLGVFIVVVAVVIAIAVKRGTGSGGGKAIPAPAPRTAPRVHAPRVASGGGSVDLAFPIVTPAENADSHLALQMTLVDNRTGATLWHTRAEFHASPANSDNVNEAVRRMVMTLPER